MESSKKMQINSRCKPVAAWQVPVLQKTPQSMANLPVCPDARRFDAAHKILDAATAKGDFPLLGKISIIVDLMVQEALYYELAEETTQCSNKQPLCCLVITSTNEHRFSQFFYCQIPQERVSECVGS